MAPTSICLRMGPLDSYCLCYLLAPFKRIKEPESRERDRGQAKRTDEGRRLSQIPPSFLKAKKLNKQTSLEEQSSKIFWQLDTITETEIRDGQRERERKKVSDRMSAIKNWKATNFLAKRNQVGRAVQHNREKNLKKKKIIDTFAFEKCACGWRSIGHLFHGTRTSIRATAARYSTHSQRWALLYI